MTAPGMGSFSGTAAWTNTFRDSQARAAEVGKKLPVIQEVSAEDLRDTEYEMTVGDLLEDIHVEPLPEFDHPLLMAGWAEVATLGR